MDNNKQPTTTPKGEEELRPNDNVIAYTIAQIQQALKKSRKLEDVRDYLRDNYNNATENNLDDLFDYYIDIQ
jgi:hypothetical protein